ncbi:hypothetical protein ACFL0G_01860 [Candidatus Zixiibacteriota bacterium]
MYSKDSFKRLEAFQLQDDLVFAQFKATGNQICRRLNPPFMFFTPFMVMLAEM